MLVRVPFGLASKLLRSDEVLPAGQPSSAVIPRPDPEIAERAVHDTTHYERVLVSVWPRLQASLGP